MGCVLRYAGPAAMAMIGLCAAGLALAGCNRSGEDPARPATAGIVPVTLRPVRVMPVQRSVEVVGTLYGDEEVTISSKVAGKIVAVLKDIGDRAAAGEALARVEPTDYELTVRGKELAVQELLARLGLKEFPGEHFDAEKVPTVERARLQADNAKAKYERGKQLHDQKPPLMSDQDFGDLQTAWEVATSNYEVEILTARALLSQARTRGAELAVANQGLSDTIIRAPFPATAPAADAGSRAVESGRGPAFAVAGRLVSVGEFVQEATAAFRLVKDDPIKLRAAVPERFVADIQVGQTVFVQTEAYTQRFEGRVARINPSVDVANRTFQIEVLLPNPHRQLRPGSFVRAFVQTRVDPAAVFVPLECVVSFAGVNKVFSVGEGRAVEVPVELGDRRGDDLEIVKGLKGTEQVVLSGISKLAAGVAVSVQAPPASGPAPAARDEVPR